MRKSLLLILAIILSVTSQAQHWLGVSATADFAWQFDQIGIATSEMGGGGRLGFVYQWQQNHFLFETGVDGEFTYNRLSLGDSILNFNMIDTKGQDFIYIGYLKDRQDISKSLHLNFPILLGAEYRYFYFLGGVKVNVNVLGNTRQTAQLATVGDYDIYYEILHDMPNHGFHDYEDVQTTGVISYNLDVRACVEVGTNIMLSKSNNRKCHLGLFAEFGILNVHDGISNKALINPDLSEYMQLELNHVYTSNYASFASVHNLFVGMRFSVLFAVGGGKGGYRHGRYKNKPCHCNPYDKLPDFFRPPSRRGK